MKRENYDKSPMSITVTLPMIRALRELKGEIKSKSSYVEDAFWEKLNKDDPELAKKYESSENKRE